MIYFDVRKLVALLRVVGDVLLAIPGMLLLWAGGYLVMLVLAAIVWVIAMLIFGPAFLAHSPHYTN